MLSRCLRRVETDSDRLKKAYALWKRKDESISMIMPPQQSSLLHIEVDSGWSGFIDLQQWFCRTYPKMAALAASHITDEQIYGLFKDHSEQLILPALEIYEPLKFNSIVLTKWVEGTKCIFTDCCFSFETPKGRIWITKLAENHLPILESNSIPLAVVEKIPFFLKYILGQSQLSLELFKQIKVGDILLIQKTQQVLCINNDIIGTYYIENEDIMIDLHNLDLNKTSEEQDDFTVEEEHPYQDMDAGEEVLPSWLDRKKNIPITLSFVLDQKKVKLGDLESLAKGERLPLSPDSYKSIKIEANGIAIAKGEIVIVDETMAVEVTSIYGESERQ